MIYSIPNHIVDKWDISDTFFVAVCVPKDALQIEVIDSNNVIFAWQQRPNFIEIRNFEFSLLNLPELLS